MKVNVLPLKSEHFSETSASQHGDSGASAAQNPQSFSTVVESKRVFQIVPLAVESAKPLPPLMFPWMSEVRSFLANGRVAIAE